MDHSIHIEAVMTRQVLSISPDTTLREARDFMLAHGIRHLPVMDGVNLVGLLSDRDIKLALHIYREGAGDLTANDIANPLVYTVSPTTPLREVARTMADEKFGCAVVTDADLVVGIFTTVDACRALGRLLDAVHR